MKKFILFIALAGFLFSCSDCNNKAYEELTVKLEATEAQLLNVNAELSRCMNAKTAATSSDSLETDTLMAQ